MNVIKVILFISILKCFFKDTFIIKDMVKLNIKTKHNRHMLFIKNSAKLYIKKNIRTKKFIKYYQFFLTETLHLYH